MTTIRCDIVSAEQELFSGSVQMVVVTGEMGELGIAPAIGRLDAGFEQRQHLTIDIIDDRAEKQQGDQHVAMAVCRRAVVAGFHVVHSPRWPHPALSTPD